MTHEEFGSIAALDAIGAASAEDAASLRAHLGACLPCRRTRDEYAQAATLLALALEPVQPPLHLRADILGDTSRRRMSPWWLAAAAALALAFVGVQQKQAHDAEVARLRGENAELARTNEKLSSEMAALAAASTRTIALSGQEVAPSASAKVFLEPDRRRALVFFHDLPANPGDKSYQLWIIRADEPKPMSAGVFDVTSNGSASIVIENLPVATQIKALAVTLEPKGGAAQPTNTRFYVAGNT